jgi:two-component system OmpR family response regulator
MTMILVVDDDPHIREVVEFALQKQQFKTLSAANGVEAIAQFEQHQPALIIMDIMMPEMSGLDACKAIRHNSILPNNNVPIIFLTAMDDEIDMIVGLEVGGDDYVCKPFSPRQLIARVRAVLRRFQTTNNPVTAQSADTVFRLGQLSIDNQKYKVFWGDKEIILTVTEINLLTTLASHPGNVFSRAQLMEKAYDNIIVSDRTIDSHIRRLRGKFTAIGASPIETVHGAGYKLGNCA